MKSNKIFRLANLSSAEIFRMPVYYENNTWRIVANLIWIGLLLLVLVGLSIIGAIMTPSFLSLRNFQSIIFAFLRTGLMAAIMVVIFSNGDVDLSVGSVGALVSIVAAMGLQQELNPVAALILGLGVALFVGLVNGVLVGAVRLPGFLITFAMAFLLRSISLVLSNGYPVTVKRAFLSVSGMKIFGWLLLILISVVSVLWVQFSMFGRKTGVNQPEKRQPWFARACSLGIPYIVSSLIAGFVGLLLMSRLQVAMPVMGTGGEFEVILAVVLGGSCIGGCFGNTIGALFGALIIATLQNLVTLSGASVYYQHLIFGLLFLVAMGVSYGYNAIVGILYRRKYPKKGEDTEYSKKILTLEDGKEGGQEPPPLPQQSSHIPNYLVQAILCTLFCCLPFGIPAIVYAAQVNDKIAAGDLAGARESSRKAKTWCWVAFGSGLALGLLSIGFMLLSAFVGSMR